MKSRQKSSSPASTPELKKLGHSWAIPEELRIPPDSLRMRVDFYHQAVVISNFEEAVVTRKVVSAMDIAHALADELSYSSGLLPDNTLWWRNTKSGQVVAIYVPPHIRKVTLEVDIKKRPMRLTIPLPGLIFLCRPSAPPWVYAVKKKPTKETDIVYKAPLCNIFTTGRTCPGTHKFPARVASIVESFFISFYSLTADLQDRSKRFPENVAHLWEFLNGKKKFPLDDLVQHGTIKDLMEMRMD